MYEQQSQIKWREQMAESFAAAILGLLLLSLGVYFQVFVMAVFCWSLALQSLQDFFSQAFEDLDDIVVVFGTGFEEGDPIFLSQGLSLCLGHLALGIKAIRFVSHNYLTDLLCLAFVNLLEPVLKIIKSFAIGDGINQSHSCSTLVVGLRNGLKPFLAGSVPNLHLNPGAIDVEGFYFEIDPDGGDMGHLVLFVHISQENVSLAHCGISNDDDLDEVVKLLFFFLPRHKVQKQLLTPNLLYQSYIFQMYQLSHSTFCHKRDLRCLDYHAGILVTGGSDNIVKMFTVADGKVELLCTHDIFAKNILSLKINKKEGEMHVLVGCADGKIYGFDRNSTPIAQYENGSPVSSIDFINNQYFVAGSWDGKATVWNYVARKKTAEYANHKYAVSVFYNPLTDLIVSGSQDKALTSWNWRDGKEVKRIQGAHNDIVREISYVEDIGFITSSNDETLKLWSSDLEEIQTLTGHSAFVFTVKSKSLGHYFSGGEDKSIKIWNDNTAIQTIQFPASVWSLAVCEDGDLFVGCSDGFLRVFSTDMARRAPHHEVEAFNKQTLESASKKSGMSAEEIKKLPNAAVMDTLKGKKQGEIRVFKSGNVPEAFMWQNSQWVKIGEVITEGGSKEAGGMSEAKYYPGDKYFEAGEYDYIFDVDDESGVPKTIPFSDGANALEAAEKYCARQGLGKGFVEQIRKFLMSNSSKIPRSAIQQSKKQLTQANLRVTPLCISVDYTDVKNPAALVKKLTEFNEQVQGNLKLTERELEYCQRIATLLENSKTYHSWKLDFKEMDTIKKMLEWPKELKFPVWDLLRAFLVHYQSEALFSGLDAGLNIINQLAAGLERENSQGIYALIFKTLANVMILNTNKNGIVKYADTVFSSVEVFSKRADLQNKGLLAAIAGFLFNFSVTVFQKNIQNVNIISMYAKILKKRLEMDGSEDNKGLMLQAGANVVFKYQNQKEQFTFLKQHLLGDEASKDLQMLLP